MTKIEWTDETWNPVTGCSKISPGCANCYAERMAKRLAGRFGYPADDPFRVTLHTDRLEQPLHWRKSRRVFVCSMSDFFHVDVPLEMQNAVFRIIRKCPQHTFQILTKRVDLMWMLEYACGMPILQNLWLGVTAENQRYADERIPYLLHTPASVRFVSVEPMLEPVSLLDWYPRYDYRPTYDFYPPWIKGDGKPILIQPGIDWVIIGCESGPGRRPCNLKWVKDLISECKDTWNVPVFVKQLDIDGRVSRDPAEWPQWAQLREYPNTATREENTP
jgi:protein gp37